MLAQLSLIKALDELDGADIMGKAVRVSRSDNVSTTIIFLPCKTDIRMGHVVVAVVVVIEVDLEVAVVMIDHVVAIVHIVRRSRFQLKIFLHAVIGHN